MEFNITFPEGKSFKSVAKRMDTVMTANAASFTNALHNACNTIAELAKQYAPLDTGRLEESTFVQIVREGPETFEVHIGLGGTTAWYALIQHEQFPIKRIKGRWKYLEAATDERKGDMEKQLQALVADILKQHFESKGRVRSAARIPRERKFRSQPE